MAVAGPVATSAAGLLTLLDDDSDDLKRFALVNLDRLVDEFWFQISASIASVEALYEDDDFKDRELAALIASKVFYYLGELDSALTYALGAGNLFDVNEQSEYVQTLVARCLDQYFALRVKEVEGGEEVAVDARLVAVVERMLSTCCEAGAWEQAVGVALEGRRLDQLERVVSAAGGGSVLQYALRVAQETLVHRAFRDKVLRLLIRLAEAGPNPDWVDICQCLMVLDDAPEVAAILNRLITGSEDDALLAYQVAFDLVENEQQAFLAQVQERLPKAPTAAASAEPAADGADAGAAPMDADDAAAEAAPLLANGTGGGHSAAVLARAVRLTDILSGSVPINAFLDFLYHASASDLGVLRAIKGAVDARLSVCHSATVLANAYMHAGTSIDTFLRDNLEWLGRATNWAKFSATAGLGVIHRGQLQQARALMAPYLPREGASGSPFSEGGALYALGLINANHGSGIRSFLLESLRAASSPVIQHGGCLGLGLAALGTGDEEAYEDMKAVLYTDDANAGEAAGIGMGLLLAGSASDKAQEMLAYAHDTQHEKIIRGLAVGLALTAYGREEGAEGLIESLSHDADPILRYGAMYAIGLAYRGTANNSAVQRLLHFAVSDVVDDVRRAAVLCLGFVLAGAPAQCPRTVALLAESFSPHVRYGAAMAVGIACAGSGLREASALLDGMASDPVDFVRQGAAIAHALVVLQQPESRVGPLRKRLQRTIEDKHEEVMSRMGSIMAAGILDAGGRNVTVGLRARSGYFRRTSIVGLALFTQYWYWYPLSYCLSLSFAPTALIGLDGAFKTPKFAVECAAKPSLFAYPPPVSAEASKAVAKVPQAVLSTTAKARERARKKEEQKRAEGAGAPRGSDAMDADDAPPGVGAKAAGSTAAAAATEGAGAPGEEDAAAAAGDAEVSGFEVAAPARVTPAQVRFLRLLPSSRWVPVKPNGALAGILVLRDTRPGEPVEYVTPGRLGAGATGSGAAGEGDASGSGAQAGSGDRSGKKESEPPPPEPFEYTVDDS